MSKVERVSDILVSKRYDLIPRTFSNPVQLIRNGQTSQITRRQLHQAIVTSKIDIIDIQKVGHSGVLVYFGLTESTGRTSIGIELFTFSKKRVISITEISVVVPNGNLLQNIGLTSVTSTQKEVILTFSGVLSDRVGIEVTSNSKTRRSKGNGDTTYPIPLETNEEVQITLYSEDNIRTVSWKVRL
jgi:hypothetical protein